MQQISSPPQVQAEVALNENFETLSFAAIFGKRHPVTTGLTWGYYGGRWGGFAVAAGTLTLSNNATNYVVVSRANGAISVSTTSTNWNDTNSYGRVYKITTLSGAVSAVEDHRAGQYGVMSGAESAVNLGDLVDVDLSASPGPQEGDVLTYRSGVWVFESKSKDAPIEIQLACSDLVNALVAATNVGFARAPRAFTITAVRAALLTASSSGAVTIDINVNGSSILSTKLTIDQSEETSVTAATPYVLSSTSIADDAKITVDIDGAGSGAKGLVITILGTRTA